MNCKSAKFKQLYDWYINDCYFGGLDRWYLADESMGERNKCVTTGFAVNKDVHETDSCNGSRRSFFYHVTDHIRVVEEVLGGIYTSENEEFNQIFPVFIRMFMLGNVYILYSEEFKKYELEVAKKVAEEAQEDVFERLEKSYPDCNFRLLHRVAAENGGWQWNALLSGLQNIEVKEEHLPILEEDPKYPIRFSFNEGLFFTRLYNIFAQYESQMQTYKALFNALHKVGDINGEDVKAIDVKQRQFEAPGVFTQTAMNQKEGTTTVDNLELVNNMSSLTESYDNIHALLNDSLGRLGLAGDDSTKAERITTGENFRALQPNMAFQQAIMNRLETVTNRIQTHFQQDVKFINGIKPNEQGIPINEKAPNGEKPEVNKPNKKWSE